MRAVEIIMHKRDGLALTEAEIRFLVQGYVKGEIPDYQVASWLMAVFQKGMTFEETGFLTRAMIDSGEVLSLESLGTYPVDKHSTGGVGDKISLVLAPLAAACGLTVPMMSGRALGHTGGTLDKLEAIHGYSTALTQEKILRGLEDVGFIMTGQSQQVVPADRLMYALRDVTGTVESIPLITASILSKKFAEGAQALVFDVKWGSGAFMKTYPAARELAVSLVETAKSLGRRAVALLTDMNQPLGRMTGNFLEVEESLGCLEGRGPQDIKLLTLRQNAWMCLAAGRVKTLEEGLALGEEKLASGEALKKFWENLVFQGGDPDRLKKEVGHRRAYFFQDVLAPSGGFVQSINAFEVGLAGVDLGVGRNKKEDPVHPNAGFEFYAKVGDPVKEGAPLVRIYAEDAQVLKAVTHRMQKVFTLGPQAPQPLELIKEEISAL